MRLHIHEGNGMGGFRLLEISSALDPGIDHPSAMSNSERRTFGVAPRSLGGGGTDRWVSVIIGRNGLGKSRTLGSVASLFADARSGRLSGRGRTGVLWRVRYMVDSEECELWSERGGLIRATRDGRDCSPDLVPLPSKVIALSTAAMDKFPLPPREELRADPSAESLYSYMGLRDHTGRASATAVALRALEALVSASETTHDRRVRIAGVFEFLGYAPRVRHTYRWRYRSYVRNPNIISDLLRAADESPMRPRVAQQLRRLVDKHPDTESDLQRIVDEAIRTSSPRGELSQVVDFHDANSSDLVWFQDMQLLKRAGLVDLAAVELERSDTTAIINLREVSSGELSLVTAFLGLAAVIRDDALVLIDEPEVSLHPEWQSQYLGLLTTLFSSYAGCHFLVATHSPLVVSDISDHAASVVSIDPQRRFIEPGSTYSGDSADEVLVKAFNVAGNNNLFVKQLLVEALRLAADGDASSARFTQVLEPLQRLAPSLEPNSPVSVLIGQLARAREEPDL